MRKVCILFGAGADAPFGIGTGGDFAKAVMGTNPIIADKMDDAIKWHYNNMIDSQDNWYPSFRKYSWKEEDLVKASLRRRNLELGKKQKDEAFRAEFDSIKDNFFAKSDLIYQYPSYMGIIDGKFSSLIAPSMLGSGRFWQVVSCYCRAYLTIMKEVLDREDYSSYMNPTEELIKEVRTMSRRKKDLDAYYSVLSEMKQNLDISVITTNYTLFCEEIAELRKDKIAYVHGRIGLYESPRDLYVYDAEDEGFGKEVVFPYFFIQSGIKPIVEQRQIKEYSKMISFMEKSDKIIILGYRLNYDDNHINSIIRSAVKKGKEVVYLAFNDGKMDFLKRESVIAKLRLAENPTNLKWREITSYDAYQVFENELK